ncbi:MAG: SPFH domain-containing protein [Eubacteriales bacterium]|nr:SPFH domain-containing protein [Eubacteriales bacterium]
MGLLKAGVGALSGVLADSWRDYITCESLDADTLAVKGEKKAGKRSSNKKGTENVISDGSIINVSDGQCMIIVESGKIADLCAEPGEYVYDSGIEPSIFYGSLGENIKNSFSEMGKRFAFGGEPAEDQRVYFINTKEITGNKYGTPSPVPFRVVDTNIGLDVDIAIRCHGEYSYRITNPMLFYTNVCGNVEGYYTRDTIDSQLKTELLTALQPAFARISEMGVRYSALPAHTIEISDALNEILSSKWRDLRGIEIVAFGVSSVNASEEDEKMIKEVQRNAVFRNADMAMAHTVGAQAQAMQDAAKNQGGMGAMGGFVGMNMAQNAGGNMAANIYGMSQMQQAQAQQQAQVQMQPQAQQAAGQDSWTCSCGAINTGRFCTNCGAEKPAQEGTWTCSSCGAVNTGKFCQECGSPKPAAKKVFRCSKCGWIPDDPSNPPKFCPQCGDVFDENDTQ